MRSGTDDDEDSSEEYAGSSHGTGLMQTRDRVKDLQEVSTVRKSPDEKNGSRAERRSDSVSTLDGINSGRLSAPSGITGRTGSVKSRHFDLRVSTIWMRGI